MVIVRVQLLGREGGCDKYCWSRVKVLSVVAEGGAAPRMDREIRVASYSSGPGIRPGVSTVYLAPYNDYKVSHLWRLAEGSGGAPFVPDDATTALSWSNALFSSVDPGLFEELTAGRFLYRSTNATAPCQREVAGPAALEDWRHCLNEEKDPFVAGLLWGGQRVSPGGVTAAPARLQRLARDVGGSGRWVCVLGDDKVGFHATLLLRIEGDGLHKIVSAALGHVEIDARGVAEQKRRADYAGLIEAIEHGDARAVRDLVRKGADVNGAGREDFPGSPLISVAAEKGNLAIVDVLLKAGARPDACCCECVTALHHAIEGGHAAVVRRLLEGGADPRRPRGGRDTPLELARRNGNPEIIRHVEDALARSPAK